MIVITHLPSRRMNECELTFLPRVPIDYDAAMVQHENYCAIFRQYGHEVHCQAFNMDCADAAFVEDVAIALDELIVLTNMGVASRRAELAEWKGKLRTYGTVEQLPEGASVEGGDVLRFGRQLLVGVSRRTNRAGIEALTRLVEPRGYSVHPVEVFGCLHLKTACAAVDDEHLLVNPDWIDMRALPAQLKPILAVDPWGANVVRLPNCLIANSMHAATNRLLRESGYQVEEVELSEFAKAEAGPTCLSLLLPTPE